MKELNLREQSFVADFMMLLEKYQAEISVDYRNCIDYSEDFVSIYSKYDADFNGIQLDLNECINYSLLESLC